LVRSGKDRIVQVKVTARHGHLDEAAQAEIREKAEKLLHYFERVSLIEVTIDLRGRDGRDRKDEASDQTLQGKDPGSPPQSVARRPGRHPRVIGIGSLERTRNGR
jgi:hypothetical protein